MAPLPDSRMIARQQNLGYRPSPIFGRPGVVRVLRGSLQCLTERLLDHGLLMPQRAGQLARDCVADHHGRQLTPGYHVAADRDLHGHEVIEHPLVESLVAAGQQGERVLLGQLVHQLVVEQPPGRRQRDHRPLIAQRHRVLPVSGPQRRLHHVDAEHHACAAPKRRVVHLPSLQRRVVAVVHVLDRVARCAGRSDVVLLPEPIEGAGKQSEDVDLHHASPRKARSTSIRRRSTSTSRTASPTSGTNSGSLAPARSTSNTSQEGRAIRRLTIPTACPPSRTAQPSRSSAHHSSGSSSGASERLTSSSRPPSACAASRSQQLSSATIGRASAPARRVLLSSRPSTSTVAPTARSAGRASVTYKLPSSPWGRPTRSAGSRGSSRLGAEPWLNRLRCPLTRDDRAWPRPS